MRKRSLGLSARYKLLLQLLLSLFIGFVALHFVGVDHARRRAVHLVQAASSARIGFYALIFLTLAGFSNAVNLTDGLDGLAAGASAIVLVALRRHRLHHRPQHERPGHHRPHGRRRLRRRRGLGFLWYNTFPADVFMGDTGSLGLGGAIAGMAVMTRTELVLLIIGGLFVIEAGSVAAQVISFKLFHRRVLLMAPLHHHFELKAWSETKIIVRFWIVAAHLRRRRIRGVLRDLLREGRMELADVRCLAVLGLRRSGRPAALLARRELPAARVVALDEGDAAGRRHRRRAARPPASRS